MYFNVFQCIHSTFEYIGMYLQYIYGIFQCILVYLNVSECI
jgi:hypothetical protein